MTRLYASPYRPTTNEEKARKDRFAAADARGGAAGGRADGAVSPADAAIHDRFKPDDLLATKAL